MISRYFYVVVVSHWHSCGCYVVVFSESVVVVTELKQLQLSLWISWCMAVMLMWAMSLPCHLTMLSELLLFCGGGVMSLKLGSGFPLYVVVTQ
jgi:hypothetical protein